MAAAVAVRLYWLPRTFASSTDSASCAVRGGASPAQATTVGPREALRIGPPGGRITPERPERASFRTPRVLHGREEPGLIGSELDLPVGPYHPRLRSGRQRRIGAAAVIKGQPQHPPDFPVRGRA